MEKTTLYLPSELKRAIEQIAAARRCSEATVIRDALVSATQSAGSPRPRLPLFASKQPKLAEQVERALRGFGER